MKGLLLASAEFDTKIFESFRILGTVLPGFDGEHEFTVEPQVTYSLGKINIAGLGRFRLGAWRVHEAVYGDATGAVLGKLSAVRAFACAH